MKTRYRNTVLDQSDNAKLDVLCVGVCVALFLVCFLVTNPISQTCAFDDWSYTWTALHYAQSGKLLYNGWATTMLVGQVIWGALFVKLFGANIMVLRFSTLPLATACVPLVYGCGRQVGLSRRLACFAALSLVLSPLFLPLAASFMTDVPSLCWLLLSAYAVLRVVTGNAPRPAARTIGWLGLLTLAGMIGGSARQTVWLFPLVALPGIAWQQRRRRSTLIAAMALWVTAGLTLIYALRWFAAQPYAVPESVVADLLSHPHLYYVPLEPLAKLLLTLIVFTLPALLPLALLAWRSLLRAPRADAVLSLAQSVAAVLVLATIYRWLRRDNVLLLFGNVVTAEGIAAGDIGPGGIRPVILPPAAMLLLLAIVVIVAVSLLAEQLLCWHAKTFCPRQDAWAGGRRALPIFAAYCAIYLGLVVIRAMSPLAAWDRYLLPVMPLVIVLAVGSMSRQGGRGAPVVGWVTLSVAAVLAVALTHDYFSRKRAMDQATASLQQAGLLRTAISGGFEFDAWTQLGCTGHMNEIRAVNPPGSYRPPAEWFASQPWIWTRCPSIHPRYVITLAGPQDCPWLAPSGYAPIFYATWLPPGRGQIQIMRVIH